MYEFAKRTKNVSNPRFFFVKMQIFYFREIFSPSIMENFARNVEVDLRGIEQQMYI